MDLLEISISYIAPNHFDNEITYEMANLWKNFGLMTNNSDVTILIMRKKSSPYLRNGLHFVIASDVFTCTHTPPYKCKTQNWKQTRKYVHPKLKYAP